MRLKKTFRYHAGADKCVPDVGAHMRMPDVDGLVSASVFTCDADHHHCVHMQC